MKTILFIPGFVCDTWSTIENYTIELTEALSDDYNIIWLAPSMKNPYNIFKNKDNRENLQEPVYVTEAKKHNIKVIVADLSKFNLLKNLLVLQKIFKEYKVDATYTEFGFERHIATICSKLLGKKTIFRAHGALGGKCQFAKSIIHKYFIDFFLPVSYYISGFIPKSKKSCVIQNSINIAEHEENYSETKEKIKKELGLEKFEYIITMIAKFNKGKRYDVAIDIVEKIKKNTDKNVGFVFLGNGELYEQYLNEVKDRNLSDSVIMPGHIKEVWKYLKASDVSMLTSLEEGLPCSLLESMNYKLPLIAFNRGWARELITNGINGYLIDIDDKDKYSEAILNLINQPKKMKKLGENSYKILSENFNTNLWKEKMKKTFNEIMN